MKLTELNIYDTVILYGMGLNGKSILNRIRCFCPNIICWDKRQGEYDSFSINAPPADFSCLAEYGDYVIIITPTIPEYTTEMIDRIPNGCHVLTLYSFDDYLNGFHTSDGGVVLEKGYCPSCKEDVLFKRKTSITNLKGIGFTELFDISCPNCHSNPRERITINALNSFFPDWLSKKIHESSPGDSRIIAMKSLFLQSNGDYSYSYYYDDVPFGSYKGEARCENLENLTFANESIDFIITTDVFEHISSPLLAFAEIGRVLRKGGAHIFTIPYNITQKSRFRAKLYDKKLLLLDKPQYHGNPISSEGSLVTVDWGYDIGKYIWESSGMETLEYTCYKPIGVTGHDGSGYRAFIAMK